LIAKIENRYNWYEEEIERKGEVFISESQLESEILGVCFSKCPLWGFFEKPCFYSFYALKYSFLHRLTLGAYQSCNEQCKGKSSPRYVTVAGLNLLVPEYAKNSSGISCIYEFVRAMWTDMPLQRALNWKLYKKYQSFFLYA
jgi:hypothetical protein